MAQLYFNQNKFNAGQLSEKLRKRSDFTAYQNGLKECTNFLPQVHGPLTKRPGTRRVGTAKSNTNVRLVPFVFSATQVYVLEFTPLKMRVYKDGALLGSPFVLTTGITSAMVPDFHYTQNGDVMYITHPDLAPQVLARNGDTDWTIHTLPFLPAPTYEAGTAPATTLTLSAASGSGRTATAGAASFFYSDDNRILVEKEGPGIASVTSYSSTTVLNIDILSTFSSTSFASGEWLLLASPFADIWISKLGPPGTIINVDAYTDIDDTANSELITNGSFASGLTDWDNHSSPEIGSGTMTSPSADGIVIDDGGFNFITGGVQENYYINNNTQGHRSYVARIRASNTIDSDNTDAVMASGDDYTINQTGSAAVDSNDKCILNGERNGIGWIEQDVTSLTANRVYCLKFRVEDSPISMQIGSASKDSDLQGELSYEIGEHEVYYYNTATTNYVQFRNNQQTNAALTEVSLKLVSVAAFRTTVDVGKFVRVLGGLIEITAVDASNTRITGIVRADMIPEEGESIEDVEVVAGQWSLESLMWTSTLGYPRVVALHDQRLYFGSTGEFPTTLWGSVIGDFNNFNRGLNDDNDSLIITPASTEINSFQWMIAEHNLFIGTGRNEFIISPGLGDATITPTARKVDIPSQWGSINHRPLRVGNAVVFIERNGTVLREMTTTVEGNIASDQELTILAEELFSPGIVSIAYQQRPTPTIWVLLEDGSVVSGVYLQNEQVMGWVVHDFGGFTYGLTVIPTTTTDQVWLAVDRFGGTSVEYMQETDAIHGALVTDSTYIYEGTATDEVDGLFWLEGKMVAIVVDGVEYPNQRVSCGHVGDLIPNITHAEIGLPVEASVIFLRPETPQQPTTGYTINAIKVALSLHESSGGELNDQELYSIFEYPFDVTDGLYSGTLPAHGINSTKGDIPEIELTHSDAKPFSLQAITYLIERSDL